MVMFYAISWLILGVFGIFGMLYVGCMLCIRVSLYFIFYYKYVRFVWGVTACRNMSSRTHAETLNFYFNSMSEPQIQNYYRHVEGNKSLLYW